MKVIFLFTLITLENHTPQWQMNFIKKVLSQEDYVPGFIRYFVERRNDPSESLKEVDDEFDSPYMKVFYRMDTNRKSHKRF